MKKIGILLSGCGVYDGAEIQEAVLAMLAIEEEGATYFCISINQNQFHTINHLTGDVVDQERNMLEESARIARGKVIEVSEVVLDEIDGLIIPGGFGSAKNFTKWAFEGPQGAVLPQVKLLLINMVNIGKPILALCVSPVVVAKSFEGSAFSPKLTIGTSAFASPYDIKSFNEGLRCTGMTVEEKGISEVEIDVTNKIITAPCYMMEASILEVRKNIQQGVKALMDLI